MYDALNVLMAMNIIKKERKEITWIGLPTNSSQECQKIEVCTDSISTSASTLENTAGISFIINNSLLHGPVGYGWVVYHFIVRICLVL